MPRIKLRPLGSLAAGALISVACATYQDAPTPQNSAGTSAQGGEPDDGGSNSTAGTTAGVSSGGKGGTSAGGSTTAGNAPTGSAGEPAGGEAGAGGAGQAGTTTQGGTTAQGGAAPGGAGGMPDVGCMAPADCDDQNPCTADDCVDTMCQHVPADGPCMDDSDDCTDDICANGMCTHPANTAPCLDDGDPCTTDVCAGDFCTHPKGNTCQCQKAKDCDDQNPCTTDACVGNKCQYSNNSLNCTDDQNPCTDDVCQAGACSHPNNSVTCDDDGNLCTTDVCDMGACTHPNIAGCCSGDGDCYDANVCTDDACLNAKCQHTNNTGSCAADTSPCTNEKCAAGKCTHPNNAVCVGSDDVVIQANRNGDFVVLNGTYLEYTGTTQGTAEVFEKVGETGTRFKLRSKTNGLYVTLDGTDTLIASADLAGAMVFDAPICGMAPFIGLNATTDLNGGAWVAADAGNRLISRSADCAPASATAWEKFQLISVTRPCAKLADCNDNNVCTDEVCGANGFCAYTDHVGTCADDANACTDDVCNTGTCTHPGNGTCKGPLVAIQANRDGTYVHLNASYLEYGVTLPNAEKFELVDQVGTQFRLRSSTNMFVTLDVNDNLIANTDFAGSMLFDAPVCDTNVGLIATSDDDAQKFTAADAANRLIARSGGCGLGNAAAWEKWTLVPQ